MQKWFESDNEVSKRFWRGLWDKPADNMKNAKYSNDMERTVNVAAQELLINSVKNLVVILGNSIKLGQ